AGIEIPREDSLETAPWSRNAGGRSEDISNVAFVGELDCGRGGSRGGSGGGIARDSEVDAFVEMLDMTRRIGGAGGASRPPVDGLSGIFRLADLVGSDGGGCGWLLLLLRVGLGDASGDAIGEEASS